MRDPLRLLQAAVLLLVGAGAVPWIANGWDDWTSRRERGALALHHGAVGRVALETGDPDLASEAYAVALQLEPHRAEWRDGLVAARVEQVLALTGSLSNADGVRLQEELGAALSARTTPSPGLVTAYGKLLLARGDDPGARKQFQRAIELDPKFAPAHLNLGLAQLRANELESAAGALQTSLDLRDDLAEARFALGQVRVRQKRWEDAATLLERASEKIEDAGLYLGLGIARLELQRWPEAQAALEKALALRGDLVAAHGPLGQAYASVGKDALAERHLKTAWEQAHDVVAYLRLGRLYERRQDFDGAMQVFTELANVEPDLAEPHFRIGLMAEVRGDLKLAEKAMRIALERAMRAAEKDPTQEQFVATARARLDAIARQTEKAPPAPKR